MGKPTMPTKALNGLKLVKHMQLRMGHLRLDLNGPNITRETAGALRKSIAHRRPKNQMVVMIAAKEILAALLTTEKDRPQMEVVEMVTIIRLVTLAVGQWDHQNEHLDPEHLGPRLLWPSIKIRCTHGYSELYLTTWEYE
jgi:hypothetical protein